MGLIARDGGGGDFELPPAGVHVARCWRVVDLGTVKGEYKGKPTASRKVLINWELLGEERMEDGSPFTIGSRYTISLGEKATLRKMLKSWRGRDFTPAELEGFDLSHIVGKPCMINVTYTDKDGKTYANVEAVMPLAGGMTAPAAVNPSYIFSIDEFDEAIFSGLSDKLKEMIAASPEYKALKGGKPAGNESHVADMDDDIPF